MTIELEAVRKVVEFTWDTGIVKGTGASIQAGGEEKREVDNDGKANVFFPLSFVGDVEITVRGSSDGEDSGVISVPEK